MNKAEAVYFKYCDSPLGELVLAASDRGLQAIIFRKESRSGFHGATLRRSHPILKKAERQLREYFDGRRKRFDVPIARAGTPFQQRAWDALLTIPYGETVCYSEQAGLVGGVKKTRAVAAANGKNPIPIIIPCHRVIGKDGGLTGYAGGL